MKSLPLTVICLCSLLSAATQARTISVETWGEDVTNCGAKTSPCETIQYALQFDARNDRIVVGPGLYEEAGTLLFDQEGVRLESTAGAHGTAIRIPGDSDMTIIRIEQSKVRIGKRGKGFSLSGATNANGVQVVFNDLEGIRIEGNIAFFNQTGFLVQGDKALVRYNMAHNNSATGFLHTVGEKVSYRDNKAIANNVGFNIISTSKAIVQRNLAYLNTATGFSMGSNDALKFTDNVASLSSSGGVRIEGGGGNTIQGNIMRQNAESNLFAAQGVMDPVSSVKKNLAVVTRDSMTASADSGMKFGAGSFRIESNTVIQSHSDRDGMSLSGSTEAISFRQNNTWDTGDGCGIYNNAATDLVYNKHFFGSADGADDDTNSDGHDAACGNIDEMASKAATRPNRTSVNKAAKLLQ